MHNANISELRAALASRKISSVELTRMFLDRIGAANGSLNAFITVDAGKSLSQAKAADAAKGGDANAKKVAGMLSVVNKAYNEVAKEKAADAAIGMAAARWSKDSTTKLDW